MVVDAVSDSLDEDAADVFDEAGNDAIDEVVDDEVVPTTTVAQSRFADASRRRTSAGQRLVTEIVVTQRKMC